MVLFKKILVLFCFLSLVFTSCRKSTGANWDVDVVIPVVNSVLNIKNFVNDTLIKPDQSGLLYVSLNREVASLKLDSIFNLPYTADTIPFDNYFPGVVLNIGQAITTFPPSELKFKIPNDVALKKVDVRNGIMTVKFSNHLPQPIDLTYEIRSATKNGSVFRISETVPTGTYSLVKDYNLSGYSLNMRGISQVKFNTIVQAYTVALSTTASSSIQVPATRCAEVEVSYSEMVPDYVEGYFGNQVIEIPADTAKFGLTDDFKASNFMLSEASMNFNIINEFGAEFESSLSNNKSINTPNNNTVLLYNNQLSSININRATKGGANLFPSVKIIPFTPDNSNIVAFISNLPDKVTYKGRVEINPLKNISGYNDFAFYNTGIRILADINIPLKFTADYFQLQKNAKVDFSNVEQLDNVNAGNIIISATNGFPFAVRLQGYMYDENKTLIDSLFIAGSNIIDGGMLNANNVVVNPVNKRIAIPVTESKIKNLKRCKTIEVVSRFIMPPNPPEIKILETYEVKVNVIAQLNYNVSLDN